MSTPNELTQIKIESMIYNFQYIGINENDHITQSEIMNYLNKYSHSGKFNETLASKLFQQMNININSQLTIEEFINGYLTFEDELRKNLENFEYKLAKEKEIFLNLEKQCEKYKTEHLNSEGFCENAKITLEITDIDIKRKLEGIKEIIIRVIYNERIESIRFQIGHDYNNELYKKFEFKPTSRNDHFEFIMKGVNEKNQIFDIGNKIFSLNNVISQEEYAIQIIIPEIGDENSVAAYINGKIILYWSDYKFYERQKKKSEKRLRKLTEATSKAKSYLLKIKEIYGNLYEKKPDIIVDFNNEKFIQKYGKKLKGVYENENETELRKKKVEIEYNNEKNNEIENNKKKVYKTSSQIEEKKYKKTIKKDEPFEINVPYKSNTGIKQTTIKESNSILHKIHPIQVFEKHHKPIIVENTQNYLINNENNQTDDIQNIINKMNEQSNNQVNYNKEISQMKIQSSVVTKPPKYINENLKPIIGVKMKPPIYVNGQKNISLEYENINQNNNLNFNENYVNEVQNENLDGYNYISQNQQNEFLDNKQNINIEESYYIPHNNYVDNGQNTQIENGTYDYNYVNNQPLQNVDQGVSVVTHETKQVTQNITIEGGNYVGENNYLNDQNQPIYNDVDVGNMNYINNQNIPVEVVPTNDVNIEQKNLETNYVTMQNIPIDQGVTTTNDYVDNQNIPNIEQGVITTNDYVTMQNIPNIEQGTTNIEQQTNYINSQNFPSVEEGIHTQNYIDSNIQNIPIIDQNVSVKETSYYKTENINNNIPVDITTDQNYLNTNLQVNENTNIDQINYDTKQNYQIEESVLVGKNNYVNEQTTNNIIDTNYLQQTSPVLKEANVVDSTIYINKENENINQGVLVDNTNFVDGQTTTTQANHQIDYYNTQNIPINQGVTVNDSSYATTQNIPISGEVTIPPVPFVNEQQNIQTNKEVTTNVTQTNYQTDYINTQAQNIQPSTYVANENIKIEPQTVNTQSLPISTDANVLQSTYINNQTAAYVDSGVNNNLQLEQITTNNLIENNLPQQQITNVGSDVNIIDTNNTSLVKEITVPSVQQNNKYKIRRINSTTAMLGDIKIIIEKPVIRKAIVRHSTSETVIHRSFRKPIIQNITAERKYNEITLKPIVKRYSTSATKTELKYRKALFVEKLLPNKSLPDITFKPVISSKTKTVKYIGPIFRRPIIRKIFVRSNSSDNVHVSNNNYLNVNNSNSGIFNTNENQTMISTTGNVDITGLNSANTSL